jgi:hypothetical protein
VSSKCFQLYYTCSDRLLTIAFPSYSFHIFSPLTVTFPKLSVILRPLYISNTNIKCHVFFKCPGIYDEEIKERTNLAPVYIISKCRLVSWLVG